MNAPWLIRSLFIIIVCAIVAGGAALAAPATVPPPIPPTPSPTTVPTATATPTTTPTPQPPTPTQTRTPTPTATVNVRTTSARTDDLAVDFGDFESTVRIWYPDGAGPFLTVLIISGSGPDHVDEPYYKRLTDALISAGYAVARYTKHYVYSPAWNGEGDDHIDTATAFMYQVSEQQLLIDANQAYRAVAARPRVDPARIVIYGQSQGGLIAAQLALAHPEAAGVILHGSPARSHMEENLASYRQLIHPFLRDIVDRDGDGRLTGRELLAALPAWEGTPVAATLTFLSSTSGRGGVNSFVDSNSDGRLDIAGEIEPVYEQAYGEPDPDVAPGSDLPAASRIADYLGPILVQQGGRDGYVEPVNADILKAALAAARHPDFTVVLYPELGHGLGESTSRYADPVEDIEKEPQDDLLSWLVAHIRQR